MPFFVSAGVVQEACSRYALDHVFRMRIGTCIAEAGALHGKSLIALPFDEEYRCERRNEYQSHIFL
jgi:hypothetical protein